jgi:hypothetical protein
MNDISAVEVVFRPGISLLLRANICESVVMGGILVNNRPYNQTHQQA